MKIFVSYSRTDALDFANHIQKHLLNFKYDLFTDIDSIRSKEIWSNTIEENISNCDIFVVIVTQGSLHTPQIENEVLKAQKENKKIIPCFHTSVIGRDIELGLDKIQRVEFDDRHELVRKLYSKMVHFTSNSKSRGRIFGSTSKIEETKIRAPTAIFKSDPEVHQTVNTLSSSFINKGARGVSQGVSSFLKHKASEYDNAKRKYTEGDKSIQSQGINVKLIFIPIIVVAIIGVTVDISYFNKLALADENKQIVDTTSLPTSSDLASMNNDCSSLEGQGLYQTAIKCYNRILAIEPYYIPALNNKGWILSKIGKNQEAIEYFDRILAIDPENNTARINKKMANERLNDN